MAEIKRITETQKNALDPETHVGLVAIAVSSLERSLRYYQHGLGFAILGQSEGITLLGPVSGQPILALYEQPQAQRQPAGTTGLYHFAILLPTRKDLGRFVTHIIESKIPVGGYADHGANEAFYFSDPDGNGIEVYHDRPRSSWQWQNGSTVITTKPIDLEGILAEGQQDTSAWSGLPEGTTLGHMHLRVANIPQSAQFYCDILGFDLITQMSSALFISAGGYHHHIGMNIWESRNGKPAPDNSVGLRFFTIQLPGEAALANVVSRLQAANWPFEQHEVGVVLYDPWRNKLLLTTQKLTSSETILSVMNS